MEIILFLLAAIVIILCVFVGLSARSPLFVCVAVAAMFSGLFSSAASCRSTDERRRDSFPLYALCGMETGRDCYAKHHIM